MNLNPVALLRDLLQRLPRRLRRWLYATLVGGFVVVQLCGQFGVTAVGPVEVADVEAALWYLAPAFGLTALANLDRRPEPVRRRRPRATAPRPGRRD